MYFLLAFALALSCRDLILAITSFMGRFRKFLSSKSPRLRLNRRQQETYPLLRRIQYFRAKSFQVQASTQGGVLLFQCLDKAMQVVQSLREEGG